MGGRWRRGRDGDLDLATVTYDYESTVSVRRNDGTGRFGSPQFVNANRGPTSMTLADVDGTRDLLIVTIYSGRDECAPERRPWAFQRGIHRALRGTRRFLPAERGGGDLDPLTANRNSSTVSVRLNNGQGRFSGGYKLAVGAQPYPLVLADVDGDGDVDLLASTLNSNTVSVRLNAVSGHFSNGSDVSGSPSALAAANVNADGDLDLLASSFANPNNPASQAVSVRLNDGK